MHCQSDVVFRVVSSEISGKFTTLHGCVVARCERAGDGDISSSVKHDQYNDDVQLDDTAGAQNERRDVARVPTSTRTSLKHINVAHPAASATCRMSTELICFTVVVVVVARMSSTSAAVLRVGVDLL